MKNDEIAIRLSADDLTVEELDGYMKNFEETAQTGTHADDGWPDVYYPLNNSTYIVSKVGLSALTRIQQREMATDPRPDIAINHVHPGLVDTDMTGHAGFTYNNVQFTPTSVERFVISVSSILSKPFLFQGCRGPRVCCLAALWH